MIGREPGRPRHPQLETLALYSTADLPLVTRLRVGRHVAHCGDCEQQVLLFRSAKTELQREANTQTLTGFEAITHWPVIEREMLGNIAVGLDAARCIENVGRKRSLLFRVSVATGLIALFVAGWVTHIPREQTERLATTLRNFTGLERPQLPGTVLRSTPEGIAVRTQGATLTILHPASAVISMSGPSSVAARYIDEESGQVTITNVYGQ
jgi:hypothetical protein